MTCFDRSILGDSGTPEQGRRAHGPVIKEEQTHVPEETRELTTHPKAKERTFAEGLRGVPRRTQGADQDRSASSIRRGQSLLVSKLRGSLEARGQPEVQGIISGKRGGPKNDFGVSVGFGPAIREFLNCGDATASIHRCSMDMGQWRAQAPGVRQNYSG